MNQGQQQPSRSGVLSHLSNIFGFPTPRVKKLLNWRQGDEDDKWAQTAVEVLVKRIQKVRGKEAGRQAMEDLERALANPDAPSNCITIPRSMDGRIQVGHRKGLPHVIYCRVWRWPDLQNLHELKGIPTCQFHYDAKLPEVCINPTHYVRVETTTLPTILVPRQPEFPPQCIETMQQQFNHHATQQNQYCRETGFNGNFSPNENMVALPTPSPDSGTYSGPNSPESSFGGATGYPHTGMEVCYNKEATAIAQVAPPPANVTPVCYVESSHWATIAYFELNVRVGESYQCFNYEITVDGFTSPQNNTNRFCLGQLSNVNRNSSIETTRRHIGRGIQLTYINGVVYARNFSEASVFVQSRNLNHDRKFHHSTVCKIPPDSSLIIFNNVTFSTLLSEAVHGGFEVVYDLTKMCTIRISFVKGWGAEYHRQDVTSTPCWIEIHMNGALKWLDSVLSTMGSPTNAIGSVS